MDDIDNYSKNTVSVSIIIIKLNDREKPDVDCGADTKHAVKKNGKTHHGTEDDEKDLDKVSEMSEWRKEEKG